MRNISIAIASILALTCTNTFAGSKIWDPVRNTCTTINCGAVPVYAHFSATGWGLDPFFIQVWANAGECLRLAVTAQTHDLEMGVFSPDIEENHWVDDDSGGSFRPLIKINPTPVKGWYIVALSHVLGSNVNGRATLVVGRYNAGNPNCASPTPVRSSSAISTDIPDELKQP